VHYGLVALAFIPLSAQAYLNPAGYTVGFTAAAVLANAPTLTANGLARMNAAEANDLQAADWVVLYAVNAAATYNASVRLGLSQRMFAAVNAAQARGAYSYSGGAGHYVTRCGDPANCAYGGQWMDVVNALYAAVLVNQSGNIPLGNQARQRAALLQTIIIIITNTEQPPRAPGEGLVSQLGAIGTGWWLGHDVIGPLVANALATYTPNYYNEIGANVASLVDAYETAVSVSSLTLSMITSTEIQMEAQFGLSNAELAMGAGISGAWGSLDAADEIY
jgi:hypothetical protein